MSEIIAGVLALLGSIFSLVAALGILRLPDIFTRMHSATKAGTVGASLILIAAGAIVNDPATWAKVVAAIFFLLLTAPLAAHMIGRASLDDRHHPRR